MEVWHPMASQGLIHSLQVLEIIGAKIERMAFYESIILDNSATALGPTKGQSYPLDFFNGERYTTASRCKIQTTMKFTNCGTVSVGIIP
jgi:hypothetical protein